jgi:raffinose/stachyose/melibiose transport system substrate-binding protein
MFLKSKIMSILLIVLVAGLVIAGGQKERPGNDLRVLNYADLTTANAAAFEGWMWSTFTERNPDITVLREDLFNEPFHQKTEAYAASGNLPDVLYVWPSGRSTTLHENKLLKDLTPFVQKDGIQRFYSEVSLDPKQQGGGYLAEIPNGVTSTHAFFINMEVLNACGLQPARTYSELKAQVPVLRARGYETIIMPNKDTWVMQSCLFSAVAGRFCGAGWEKEILAGRKKFTDSDFVNALEFIKTLYADGVILPSSIGMDYGDGPGLFATNKGAYYIDGDWRVGAFITDSSTGQALITPARQANIRITVFPDIEGAKINKSSSAILGTGWAMRASIPAGSEREKAAWELIKWLSGNEVMTQRFATGGVPSPARTDINTSGIALEPMQIAMGNFAKEYSVATCVIDGVFHSDVYTPINDGLQELGLGSGKTPQQIAAETQSIFDAGRTAKKW